MNMTVWQRIPWVAAALIVAMLVHLASLYAIPHLVMARALTKLGTANAMHIGHRPDATSRAVVRPSPDLLYAACPYDLSNGPLRVTAQIPHGTYWSISAFDSATNNFFVHNDSQTLGDSLEVLLMRRGQAWPPLGNALERALLISPTTKGLILIRTLIDNDKNVAALQAALHKSTCETVATAPRLR
jgi:uncharacterized membrane protein